jgi:hypothetical protein
MSPNVAWNQEWLCLQGPAAIYWTELIRTTVSLPHYNLDDHIATA